MNLSAPDLFLLEEGFRWFGPGDPVPLSFIRQAGARAVFTSLHQIPYGEVWPREAIRERKQMIEDAGLRWTAVESVPVHEDIKTGRGDPARKRTTRRSSWSKRRRGGAAWTTARATRSSARSSTCFPA
jgi:mannonate dehydratase